MRILNYIVTSNHIHLLVADDGYSDAIPRSMQLLAGRIGQEYNQRKNRQGAFWQDRYHAAAVQSNEHLIKCLTYIDLNMVRAGVITHPQERVHSGYNEIQKQPGIRSKGRKIIENEDDCQLRDRQTTYGDEAQNLVYWKSGGKSSEFRISYKAHFTSKMAPPSQKISPVLSSF